MAYGLFEADEARSFQPKIVHVDAANKVVEISADPASAPDGLLSTPHRY
jgi:aspartate 1-decarboxylase